MDLDHPQYSHEAITTQFFEKMNQYPHYAYAILLMNGAPSDLYDCYHALRKSDCWPSIQSGIQQQMQQILTRITSTDTKPVTQSHFSPVTQGNHLIALANSDAISIADIPSRSEAGTAPTARAMKPGNLAEPVTNDQPRPAWRCPKKDCPRYNSPYFKKGHFINHLKNVHDQRSISPDRHFVDSYADSIVSQNPPEAAQGSRGIPFTSDTSSSMRQHVNTAPSRMYPDMSSEGFFQRDIAPSALSFPNDRGRSQPQINDTNHWQEAVIGYQSQFNLSHNAAALQNSHPYLIARREKATLNLASDAEDAVFSCDWDNQGMDQFIEQRRFG